MKNKSNKKLSNKEALKIIGGSLEYWGSTKDRIPNLDKISLVPVGKNGKEFEWFGKGWEGVIEYATALGIDYVTVGEWLEKNFGNRPTLNQILFAQAGHQSLSMVDHYRKPRIKMAPSGKESDMHYAIRMKQTEIFKLYKNAGGKSSDKYKGISQMYKRIYKARPKFVEAYLQENNQTKAQRKKVAAAISKALGTKAVFKKILK